jgi:hypothetical protein
VGSYDSYRATVDVDRVLARNFSLRLNGLFQTGEGWRAWEKTDQRAVSLAATWAPREGTTVRASYDYGRQERNRSLPILPDAFSSWTGVAVPYGAANAGATSFAATGTRAVITGTTNRQTWIQGQIYNFQNTAIRAYRQPTGGTGLPVFNSEFGALFAPSGGAQYLGPSFAGSYAGREILPAEQNWVGPNGSEKFSWGAGTVTIEQKLGPISLELAGAVQRVRQNRLRPANNANFVRIDPNVTFPGNGQSYLGEFYVDLEYFDQRVRYDLDDLRLTAVYDWQTNFMTQRLIAGASWHTQLFSVQNAREVVLPGTPGFAGTRFAENNVTRRYYFRDGNDRASTFGPSAVPGVTEYRVTQFAQYSEQEDWSLSLAALGSYADGRVRSMLGYRTDRFEDYRVPQASVANADPATGVRYLDPANATTIKINQPTVSAGLVAFPLKSDVISFYGNYSESFRLVSANALIDDAVAPPRLGDGVDYGVRFSVLDSRITGGVSFYDINFSNNSRTISAAAIAALRQLSLAANPASTISATNSTDTVSTRSKGWEAEVVTNLTTNWRLAANYSETDPRDSDTVPRFRAYWAEVQANVSRIDPVLYAANAPVVQSFLLGNGDGVISPGTRRKAINVVSRYDFTAAPLKGIFVTGAASRRSLAKFTGPAGFSSLPDYWLYDASLGKRFNLPRKMQLTVVGAVRNLTDESYVTGNATSFLTYGAPREFNLTATLSF